MASHIKTIKYYHSLHVYAQTMKEKRSLKSQPVKNEGKRSFLRQNAAWVYVLHHKGVPSLLRQIASWLYVQNHECELSLEIQNRNL